MSSEGKEATEALEETHLSKKAKTLEDKPPDSAVKSAVHPTGAKFTNTWLWNHFKLSPRHDRWALCSVCEKEGAIAWIPRADGSTSKMKRHLIEEHDV